MSTHKAIERDEVKHVAKLARLHLDDDELGRMTQDLCAILAYVRKLDELDTTGIPPTSHPVPLSTRMRSDESSQILTREEGLQSAPERIGMGFGVPKIIE